MEAIDVTNGSNRLFVRDKTTGLKFLIDTGSDISLLPIQDKVKPRPSDIVLYAANNTRINTYGERRLTLNLGLRRPIHWNFCRASVSYPIIGADLLAFYGLNDDIRGRKLVDNLTQIVSKGGIFFAKVTNVSTIEKSSFIASLLTKFPTIT